MSVEPSPDRAVHIRVDRYECASGVPAALRRQGVAVEVAALEAGDYDVGQGVLVERKSTRDLHDSVLQGRLWRQVASLRRSARVGLVLVEGRDLDAGRLQPAAVGGVLLALVAQGIVVLRTTDPIDTATWLRLLAAQAQSLRTPRDRPVYAQLLKRPEGRAAEAMLCAVPGISVITARALLGRFGSVARLSAATEAELRSVPGVGPVRAASLHRAVHSG
jgi:ERCC4-type nuclease